MEQLKNHILDSRKIVIKIGSNVLSDKDGAVNKAVIHNIVEQVNSLMEMGKQVILVSSGAGICGVGAINKWSRRGDINYKQALCAIGQVELLMAYKEYFGDYAIHVAQMLLTERRFRRQSQDAEHKEHDVHADRRGRRADHQRKRQRVRRRDQDRRQ